MIQENSTIVTAAKKAEIKALRAEKLADTDWIEAAVARRVRAGESVTVSAEWDAYRQELSDITEQEGYPDEVTWPTEPTCVYYESTEDTTVDTTTDTEEEV